ncbi:arsenate reductase/protein-tyrosine-phosphatase family protein [Enterococcus faecium]|uniref:arsenate reductase/protein-tyrosine-phosphatase family protein n=1 Tax=Enterococcus faecium TaxID=1352 RepID=UPI000763A5C5|nr:arsenate reductase [Enterococcus faecium]KWW91359.1 arsenate reductase [Enterococcus faecium]RRQ82675.1 arsenate reductase (thioredoxin) [Enterococcus faecium]
MKKIYFLCTGNSCRSQIAEGYARKYLSPSMFEIRSAGIETHGLNPRAFFFKQTSDLIDRDYFTQADLIITLCGDAKDKCPAVPNNHEHLHWDLKDPAQAVGSEEEILAEFRKVREGIKRKVLDLNQRTSIV